MGDWQELCQAVFIGLIFAFLVAKLISTVVSFRDENLKVVRLEDLPAEAPESDPWKKRIIQGKCGGGGGIVYDAVQDDDEGEGEDEDDDWEGIESTELDEMFSAATAFVAATAVDRSSPSVSNDVQLQLYGLYKIATEGPCTTPQPSPLKMTARAKWTAWQKLGAMPPEEAMQKYIMIVNDSYPSWATGSGSTYRSRGEGDDTLSSASASKETMGPVFSSFIHEEESNKELKLDALHVSAREGEVDTLLARLDDGFSVNMKDGEGRTPLHWAVDRGHLDVVEMLISRKADVNAKDGEGQTPLHYAALCERPAIADLLTRHGATPMSKTMTATLLMSFSDAHTFRPLMLSFTRSLLYRVPKVSTLHTLCSVSCHWILRCPEAARRADILSASGPPSTRRQWKHLRRRFEVGMGSSLTLPSPDLARFRHGHLYCVHLRSRDLCGNLIYRC
ncbi:unnamed protein product [Spirodela intermedia]|uniref:ACB domain-containing protein n=1 Tax=Spirodela intermedia TaxID=51605 RepID=A0A7I8ID08_SPIIN|nr:unnamed protein product [Spirodela intermedia]CAA6655646.1 unnamed protein product [Spirodela intermedia]